MQFNVGDRVGVTYGMDDIGTIESIADGGYMVRFDYGGLVFVATQFLRRV